MTLHAQKSCQKARCEPSRNLNLESEMYICVFFSDFSSRNQARPFMRLHTYNTEKKLDAMVTIFGVFPLLSKKN
jgi:hypothetical protein